MKLIIITILESTNDEKGMKAIANGQWPVADSDENGKIRAEIGEFLSNKIGKYHYKTSNWITTHRAEG